GKLTNVNAALFNGLTTNAFAPASGSTNYIQNQTLGIQNASFQISGSGLLGGTVSASALVASNATVNATLTASNITASGTITTTNLPAGGPGLNLRGIFVGVGRSAPISAAEFFGIEAPVVPGNYGGMYIDTSTGGWPFYGYSVGGVQLAWTYVDA